MERDPEQALLVELRPLVDELVAQVEERLLEQLALGAHDPDQADLLDDEHAIVALGLGDRERRGQPFDRGLQVDPHLRLGRRAQRHDTQRQGTDCPCAQLTAHFR